MIPFLDTWRDDNLTLGYDFGPGELVTQGGSIRYVDKPKHEGSVLTGVPLIDRGNEKPTEQEVINVPPADSIKDGAVTLRYDLGPGELTTQGGDIGYTGKEPQNEKSLDDVLAYVDTLAPRKPAVPDPEVINIPPAPFSQQEIEMRQAEQALQEEREADKQRGSEGYEAKEDGVFARLKNWGSGVHDYLFGKGNEMDELMDAVDDIEAEKAKEEKGVVGYYGGKLADLMLGPNYGKEWDEIKKEISEKGLLGYIPQKGATLLENMARSPYARFVDPTTVLGGQRRMVNDIDAYQNRSDLTALREDLLKQDADRLRAETAAKQTEWGQYQDYLNAPPEQQAGYREFAAMRHPNRTGALGVGSKNKEQLMVSEANARFERDPERYGNSRINALNEVADELSPNLRGSMLGSKYVEPGTATGLAQKAIADDIRSGKPARQAISDYRSVSGDYTTPDAVLLGAKTPGSYQAQSMDEKLKYEERKKGQDYDLAAFDKVKTAISDNASKAATNSQYGKSLKSLLNKAASEGIHVTGGGDLGKALRNFGANYGLVDEKTKQIVAGASVLSEAIFGNQIANIIAEQNVGSITERERELFARQALDLGASEEAVRLRLDLYILANELAINRARKLASLSNLDPLEQKRQFEDWQNNQFTNTENLVRAVVDSHLGAGSFDTRERRYNGGI